MKWRTTHRNTPPRLTVIMRPMGLPGGQGWNRLGHSAADADYRDPPTGPAVLPDNQAH